MKANDLASNLQVLFSDWGIKPQKALRGKAFCGKRRKRRNLK